jgi:hypothetical protein
MRGERGQKTVRFRRRKIGHPFQLFFRLNSSCTGRRLGGGVEERADAQSLLDLGHGGLGRDVDSARLVGEQVEVVVAGLCIQVGEAQGDGAGEHWRDQLHDDA